MRDAASPIRYSTPDMRLDAPPSPGSAVSRTAIVRAQSVHVAHECWREGSRSRPQLGRRRSTTGPMALRVDSLQDSTPWRFACRAGRRPARRSAPRRRCCRRQVTTAPPACCDALTRRLARSRCRDRPTHDRYRGAPAAVEPALRAARARRASSPSACWPSPPRRSRRSTTARASRVLLNFAGVVLYELGARSSPPRRSSAPPSAWTPTSPTSPATCASAGAAAKRASRRRRACRRGRCAPLRDLGPRAKRVAQPPRPAAGHDAQPVHDRQGRGGDAAALPGRRRRARRRDRRRRHRLDRPHRRDRRVLRRDASCTTSGPATSPRPATSRLDAATGDWLIYLDADEVLVAADGRAAARADRPHLARGLLPGRDQPHRRARGRHGRPPQRAAPLPQPPRVPLRGPRPRADRPQPAGRPARAHRAHRRSASSTSATSAPSATPRRSRAATSSCCERQVAEGGDTPFLHFNLGSEHAAAGDGAARADALPRAWDSVLATTRERARATASSRRCARRLGQGAAR